MLAGELGFAEALEAIAQAALQRRRRIGIESNEIPERLAAVFAQPCESGGVRVGGAGDGFSEGGVGMLGESVERLGVGTRMLTDEAEQVKVFLGSLFHELLKHFRLSVGAEYEADLFVPSGIDVI